MAGCLGSSSPSPSGSEAATPGPLAARDPDSLILTNCSGVAAFAFFPGRGAPGERPAGWPEMPETSLTTEVGMRTLACQRVSLGPFERGPVRLAFDWHDNAQAPPSCKGEADTPSRVFGSIWTDDAGLAAHLRERYAMPAFHSPIVDVASAVAAGHLVEWSWGPPDGPSRLTVLDSGMSQAGSEGFVAFWPAGDGVGRLTVQWTATLMQLATQPAHGAMRPPMLAGDFVGTGLRNSDLEGEGRVERFLDAECGVPA